MDDVELLTLAATLATRAGRGPVRALKRLEGGKNNRVFRVETDAESLALKLYHADPRDTRDRLAHEWGFLVHSWARGVRTTPEPLARDAAAHAGLYSFVSGEKLRPGDVDESHIDAALDFILQINTPPRDIAALPQGSEACFSLDQHLATVDQRVARLSDLDLHAPFGPEAATFVRASLVPAWREARARIDRAIRKLGLAVALERSEVCLSPSDFGFHNALVENGRVAFVDFEYAGQDDPAKLASDFFCCPEIPAPVRHHGRFVDGLVEGLGLAPPHAERCRILLDAYRVKWSCIVLNDFLPLGADRRAFADHAQTAERLKAQLDRAKASLDRIGSQT
ncbi:phosphotransferase [Caulobacter sp. LARHSG274]